MHIGVAVAGLIGGDFFAYFYLYYIYIDINIFLKILQMLALLSNMPELRLKTTDSHMTR